MANQSKHQSIIARMSFDPYSMIAEQNKTPPEQIHTAHLNQCNHIISTPTELLHKDIQ